MNEILAMATPVRIFSVVQGRKEEKVVKFTVIVSRSVERSIKRRKGRIFAYQTQREKGKRTNCSARKGNCLQL